MINEKNGISFCLYKHFVIPTSIHNSANAKWKLDLVLVIYDILYIRQLYRTPSAQSRQHLINQLLYPKASNTSTPIQPCNNQMTKQSIVYEMHTKQLN